MIQTFKIRKQQRFPSCQQEKKHTGIFHLPPDLQPLIRRSQPASLLHFLPAQPDITHITVHIAEGKQFQAAVDGNLLFLCPSDQGTLHGRSAIVHTGHSSLLIEKNRQPKPRFLTE